ncbi:MAG: SpoIVB peptidase S55 domain-containing protein, partial [Vicinamibacterales bacterium]
MTTPRSSAVVALAVAIALLLGGAPGAQTRLMPIDEIRPGMVGTGRTVFSGSKLEDFEVHILGVLRNVIAPNRDLILARLEGGPLAKTGVIAGMSGSPVYVDGRLIGAVSYALGQFATEPIAGITPIAEMTDATTMGVPGPATRPVALSWPPKPEELFDVWARDLGRSRPLAHLGAAPVAGLSVMPGAMLRPIAVPLMASGLEPGVLEPLAGAFSA